MINRRWRIKNLRYPRRRVGELTRERPVVILARIA
jgi:hypothetical protein